MKTPQESQSKDFINDSTREHLIDKWICGDVTNIPLRNKLFIRLIAKDRKFQKVDFTYSIFDASYLRECKFDSCNFTGCRFVGTNFHGSKFSGCNFDYATFEKTIIDPVILDTECPAFENLKMRFARSLRVNFQQLGDANGVNKAIAVELDAKKIHLWKSWNSNDRYYREKYQSWERIHAFFRWGSFKSLDFIWGNGENPFKLLRFVLIILLLISIGDTIAYRDPGLINSYLISFLKSPEIFLGVLKPSTYPNSILALITLIKLIMLSFFLSILIKRFNRR